jgi:hypothetical protein
MPAAKARKAWRIDSNARCRPLGRFGIARLAISVPWLGGATLAAATAATAGESGRLVVTAVLALALFGVLAARSACLGYTAAPQGLVVLGLWTTHVIPWRHIQRVRVAPNRWGWPDGGPTCGIGWVAQIEYGPRRCAPLFTVRSRRAAQRLAAAIVAEVHSRR